MICIYKIVDDANKCLYIGGTINYKRRIKDHKSNLKKGNHYNNRLQLHYNKYGFDKIIFQMIELVNSKDDLLSRELYFIQKSLPLFNYCIKQPNNRKGVKSNPETIEKRRLKLIGQKRTNEMRERMSKAQIGKNLSAKTKKKMSKSLQYVNSKKVINQITKEVFMSAKEAAIKNNIKPSTLVAKLNGQNKNNTTFKYL